MGKTLAGGGGAENFRPPLANRAQNLLLRVRRLGAGRERGSTADTLHRLTGLFAWDRRSLAVWTDLYDRALERAGVRARGFVSAN